jgi:anti-sigma B factor antagonist
VWTLNLTVLALMTLSSFVHVEERTMVAGLEITSTERAGCCVLTAIGQLDLAHSRKLEVTLIRHAGAEMPLVLDLGGIEFMDSSGLYVVLRTSHELRRAGQRLIVVPSPIVLRLLEVAGVGHVLATCPSVEEALASLASLGASVSRPETAPAAE